MGQKPTYEELEQRVQALEQECRDCRQVKEQDFLKSESLHSLLFHNLNDGVFVHPVLPDSQPGSFIYVNDAACSILGYTREELSEMTPWHLDDPEMSRDYIPQAMQELMEKHKAVFEAVQVTKLGQKIHVEVNANVCRFEDRDYIVSVVRDITERKQSVQTLNQKNEEQALLLESIPTQIWYLTDSETYGAVNQAHANFLGLAKKELEYRSLFDFLSEDIAQNCKEGNQVVFQTKSRVRSEEWVNNAHGEPRLIAITKTPKLDENSSVEYVVCAGSDITESKRAEEQLRLQSLVLDQIEDLVTITDLSGVITYVNQAESRALGYSQERLIGRKTDIYGDDPAKGATQREVLEKTLKEGLWRGEVVNYARDGQEMIMDCRTQVIYNDQGEPVGLCGISTDITERKQAEEWLRNNLGLLNSLIESSPDIVFYKDTQGVYLGCNSWFEEFVGSLREEIIGRTDYDLFDKDLADFFRYYDKQMLEKMQPSSNEEWIDYPDGRQALLDMLKTPYLGPEGDLIGILGIGRDITKRKRDEEALRESEKRLADIIEFFPDAILAIDREKRVTIWNRAIEEMTGIPAAEMIGRGGYAYTVPFYGEARPQLMDLIFEDSEEIRARYPKLTRNVDTLLIEVFCHALYNNIGAWVFAKASPLRDAEGDIIGAIESIRDITEQKQAEKALEQTNRTLQQMLDGTQDVIGFQHPDHTVIRYNRAGYELLGLSPEDVRGEKCYELIGRDRECEICATRLACKSKRVETVEKYQPELARYVKATANPVLNDRGDIAYVIEQLTDITTRKRAEKALQESEKRFRQLLEDVKMVAVQGYDENRRVIYWNKASENLYGYTKKEALGAQLEDLIIPEKMREQVIQDIKAWLKEGGSLPPGELELMRKDSSLVPVYSSHVMQEKTDGQKEFYCIDVELTEIKRVTDQLIQAKEQAEAANRAKSEFLANMSHEIRTPFNGLQGMLQLLETTKLNEEQKEYVHWANNSLKRLLRLLSDILDLSKIEADKLEIIEDEFQINEIMHSIEDIFKQIAVRNGNQLEILVEKKIPNKLIGDSTRLTQVLFNLVGNACKYTSNGKVEVHASFIPGTTCCSCRILFVIEDTGKGIPEEMLEHIFDTFTQANFSSSPYARQYEGAGLGLPLVSRLVNLMNGNVALCSEEGEGTAVFVSLPFKIPQSFQTEPTEESLNARVIEPQNIHVLLVDDDEMTQEHITRLLEKVGYKVSVAGDGQTALYKLTKGGYGCILMDVQMPVLDGVEATKEIRSSKANFKNIPIIALTSYAMSGDREKFLEAGMDDYIAKPVDKEELLAVLERNIC